MTETPPRTWGRPSFLIGLGLFARNTPTHVGKTLQFYPSRFPGLETPPRTWGRPVSLNVVLGCVRNTPTHVGKTGSGFLLLPTLEKHPHARGEDSWQACPPYGAGETPPRTWGRRDGLVAVQHKGGNTPTHVGKTLHGRNLRHDNRKHPHARGEDLEQGLFEYESGRNTPTHVGKTNRGNSPAWRDQKHPHARGEDSGCPDRERCPGRNTPTHVGKTLYGQIDSDMREKHPHARGEDLASRRWILSVLETPPRTWGRPAAAFPDNVLRGNTPTHVGKTRLCSSRGGRPRKHPHARGEDRFRMARRRPIAETPPRTWGRRGARASSSSRGRNTPTHVGKTVPTA